MKNMKTLLLVGATAIIAGVPAYGQTATNSPPTEAVSTSDQTKADDNIVDIVVTARKTEEKLQTVPVTVTALGTLALKQQTIQSTNDVQYVVPGLDQAPEAQGGNPNFAIRGTRQLGAIGSQGGVAVYIDYVPVQSTGSIAYSTYDMQSIQVLKGPQGTLFGKNTTGGAIIFAPNKPTHEFEGYLTGGYGTYDRKELTGVINLPVGDTLALRVAGSVVDRDGYAKNIAATGPKTLDDERRGSARAILRWTPSDAFTNDLMFDYTRATLHPVDALTLTVGPPCTTLYPTLCQAAVDEQTALGRRKVNFPNPRFQKTRDYGLADTASYDFGDVTVRNILSYRNYKYHDIVDPDGLAAVPVLQFQNENRNRALIDEVNIIGKLFDGRIDYTLGLYYSDIHFVQQYNVGVLGQSFDADGNATGGLPSYFGIGPVIADNRFHTVQRAIFGQVNYHVDDKFTVTLGARYTNEKQKLNSSLFSGTVSPTDNSPACITTTYFAGNPNLDAGSCIVRLKQSFGPVTWNFSLNYQASAGTLIFATASRGFQAGGFNIQVPIEEYQRYKPETVQSFETGVKSDWRLGGRPVRTNLALFYAKYQQQQRSISDNLPNGQSFQATFNAANATIYGLEAAINYRPTPELELSTFYSYTHGKYDQFNAPPVGINGGRDLSGSEISSTPRHTLGGTIAYTVPLESGGQVRASITGYYRSQTYTGDLRQTPFTLVPSYALFNGRVDVLKTIPVDLAFYVNNIANKVYPVYVQDTLTTLGYTLVRYGAPRTIGAEVTFKF